VPVADYPRPILPRSRHRPLAVVDGNLTNNFNKTGVRLWTAPHGYGAINEHTSPANIIRVYSGIDRRYSARPLSN
jgi:hypothetical protein